MKRSAPKSRRDSTDSGKKQQSLKSSFMNAAKASPSAAPIDVATRNVSMLDEHQYADLEGVFENYKVSWGDKCQKESNKTRGGASRDDIDLDFRGMKYITSFNNDMQLAVAQNVSLPTKYLEYLVLIVRNDVVHQSTQVSASAQAALMQYLKFRPYAKRGNYSLSSAAGSSKQSPFVSTTESNVWLPMEKGRSEFASKFLMLPDMSISGRNARTERLGGSIPTRQLRDVQWGCPAELFLHCVEKALQSAEVDFNGDLLLLQYLVTVVEQDAEVRVAVYNQLGGKQPGEVDADDDTNQDAGGRNKMEGPRRAVLENSLAWRLFAGQLVSPQIQRDLIRGLVGLVTCTLDTTGSDDDMAVAEDEPEDDAPAGACIFTRPELAALAARFLRLLLSIFGSAEASGAFLATGKHRSAGVNYRMALDSYVLEALASEKGICKTPEAAGALFRVLAPRDCLRLIGLLAAEKFSKTYSELDVQGTFSKLVGDIGPYLHTTYGMLDRGTDVKTFFQVDISPVLASFHREPSRAIKTYKSAEYLAGMISAIASAVCALDAAGKQIPTGSNGMEGLIKELTSAITAIATLAKGEKEGSSNGLMLSKEGVCELVCAQMAVANLSAEK